MRYFYPRQRHAINSQESTAVMIEFQLMAGSARMTAAIEQTKMMIPKIRHLIFFIPIRPKIPAKSVRIPTAAEAIAPISSAKMAWNAEIGENRPQKM